MFRIITSALLVALFFAAPASAHLNLSVEADHPAEVYLGSALIGETPLEIPHMKIGVHRLRVISRSSGEERTFRVISSKAADTFKSIDARFGQSSSTSRTVRSESPSLFRRRLAERERELSQPLYPSRYYQAPVVQQAPVSGYDTRCSSPYPPRYSTSGDVYRQGAVYGASPAYAPGYAPAYNNSGRRDSHRFRNVLLGAGLVNEVFNNGGNSRRGIRKGVLGATILNELIRGSGGGNRNQGFGGGLFGF